MRRILESSIDEMQLANVSEVIAESERGLLKELDFRSERANLLQMRENLELARPMARSPAIAVVFQMQRPAAECSTT